MVVRSRPKRRTAPTRSKPAAFIVAPPDGAKLGERVRELPGLIRQARAQVADAPEVLRHLADALEGAIHEFTIDDEPRRLESASVQILASTTAAGSVLF